MDKEAFDRIKGEAIEEVGRKHLGSFKPQEKIAIHRLLEELLEEIMKEKRKIFFEFSANNKGNRYYPRTLTNGSFKLNVDVLRDRKGAFRPHILTEPYKRVDESYVDLLMSLVINGYSESQLLMSLKELPYLIW